MQDTKDPFAVRHPFIASGVGIATLVAVVLALAIGGIVWKIEYGRHVQPRLLNIEGQNFRKDFAFQQGLRDQIDAELVSYDDPNASTGQKHNLATQVCNQIAQLTGTVPGNVEAFKEAHCS